MLKFNIFFVLIILLMKLLYSQPHQQPYSVKVVKIDSTKDYMLIYAVSNERKFKIVSRKVENDCKNVVIGAEFKANLISMNETSGSIQGCDVHYGWPNGNDIRNETDWECDIFLTDDIFGLCYTQNEEDKSQYKKWIETHPLNWSQVRGKRENDKFGP